MAIVHGNCGAESALISKCPFKVSSFDDLNALVQSKNALLSQLRKDFYAHLPKRIEKESNILDDLTTNVVTVKEKWDDLIANLHATKERYWKKISSKRLHYIPLVGFIYLRIWIASWFLKPIALRKVEMKAKEQTELLQEYKGNPGGVFEHEQGELIQNVNELQKITTSNDYHGAKGELTFLQESKKLSNQFHVIPDVQIGLYNWALYKGERNLRSAQLDFVIVSVYGIWAVEVKNWSPSYKHRGLSPHQQIDRAGVVLRKFLRGTIKYTPRKVLVSTNQPFKYDKNYRNVYVRTCHSFVDFVKNQNEQVLSKEEVEKIVNILCKFQGRYYHR